MRDSSVLHEGNMKKRMFNIKTMTLGAMFVAAGVVLSFIRIPLSAVTEITLTGLPIAAGDICWVHGVALL